MVFLEVAYSVVLRTVLKGTKLTTAQKCLMFRILLAQTKKMQVKIQCSAVCRRNGNKKSFANYKNKD